MNPEKKVTNKVCAQEIGMGLNYITAVRKMLGIPGGVRKVFASQLRAFLKKYPDFQARDAQQMEAFKARHPEFEIPHSLEHHVNH